MMFFSFEKAKMAPDFATVFFQHTDKLLAGASYIEQQSELMHHYRHFKKRFKNHRNCLPIPILVNDLKTGFFSPLEQCRQEYPLKEYPFKEFVISYLAQMRFPNEVILLFKEKFHKLNLFFLFEGHHEVKDGKEIERKIAGFFMNLEKPKPWNWRFLFSFRKMEQGSVMSTSVIEILSLRTMTPRFIDDFFNLETSAKDKVSKGNRKDLPKIKAGSTASRRMKRNLLRNLFYSLPFLLVALLVFIVALSSLLNFWGEMSDWKRVPARSNHPRLYPLTGFLFSMAFFIFHFCFLGVFYDYLKYLEFRKSKKPVFLGSVKVGGPYRLLGTLPLAASLFLFLFNLVLFPRLLGPEMAAYTTIGVYILSIAASVHIARKA